jgi:hypothetical protein
VSSFRFLNQRGDSRTINDVSESAAAGWGADLMDGGPDADSWQQVAELLEGEVADPNRFCEALLVNLLHAHPSLLNDSTMGNCSSRVRGSYLATFFAFFIVRCARDECQLLQLLKPKGRRKASKLEKAEACTRAGAGRLGKSKQNDQGHETVQRKSDSERDEQRNTSTSTKGRYASKRLTSSHVIEG